MGERRRGRPVTVHVALPRGEPTRHLYTAASYEKDLVPPIGIDYFIPVKVTRFF